MSISIAKLLPYLFPAFLLMLILSFIYFPVAFGWVSITFFVVMIGLAIVGIIQKHAESYRKEKITRTQLLQSIALDTLGLIVTIFAASYLGGLSGTWASHYGLYTGLAVGIVVGFSSAWGVRKLWNKVISRSLAKTARNG